MPLVLLRCLLIPATFFAVHGFSNPFPISFLIALWACHKGALSCFVYHKSDVIGRRGPGRRESAIFLSCVRTLRRFFYLPCLDAIRLMPNEEQQSSVTEAATLSNLLYA